MLVVVGSTDTLLLFNLSNMPLLLLSRAYFYTRFIITSTNGVSAVISWREIMVIGWRRGEKYPKNNNNSNNIINATIQLSWARMIERKREWWMEFGIKEK